MIIEVNYRLLPESNGIDIMRDVTDFWEWLPIKLPEYLQSSAPSIKADLSKVITYRDSTGGYPAIYSGFTQTAVSINTMITIYPVINPRAIKRNQEYLPFVLDNHIRAIKPGKIVTSVFPPERLELGSLLTQQSRIIEFFGVHKSLLQIKSVQKVPYLLILHKDVDRVIPVQRSIRFKEEAERLGIKDVTLRIKRGGEHGFDKEATLETPWLAEALKKVTKLWLK
jgi:acetyl esterase/lipase